MRMPDIASSQLSIALGSWAKGLGHEQTRGDATKEGWRCMGPSQPPPSTAQDRVPRCKRARAPGMTEAAGNWTWRKRGLETVSGQTPGIDFLLRAKRNCLVAESGETRLPGLPALWAASCLLSVWISQACSALRIDSSSHTTCLQAMATGNPSFLFPWPPTPPLPSLHSPPSLSVPPSCPGL